MTIIDETFTMQLARRLCAASEVLGELARRDGRVREAMRMRLALERIVFEDESSAKEIAKGALRW